MKEFHDQNLFLLLINTIYPSHKSIHCHPPNAARLYYLSMDIGLYIYFLPFCDVFVGRRDAMLPLKGYFPS